MLSQNMQIIRTWPNAKPKTSTTLDQRQLKPGNLRRCVKAEMFASLMLVEHHSCDAGSTLDQRHFVTHLPTNFLDVNPTLLSTSDHLVFLPAIFRRWTNVSLALVCQPYFMMPIRLWLDVIFQPIRQC